MSKFKKIIPYVLILIVLAELFVPVSGVQAATPTTCVVSGGSTIHNLSSVAACQNYVNGNYPSGTTAIFTDLNGTATTVTSNGSGIAEAADASKAGGWCSIKIFTVTVDNPVCGVAADLLMIPMMLTSWLLWLAGVLLNWVLDYTVINLAKNITSISGIQLAWSTIRDLFNILFIFILLYVAIGTILGRDSVNWKKSLTSVVIAVVLINFSMFFAEVIIDASNIVTLGFYNQIVPTASVANGLSDAIMKPLGLASLWNPLQGSGLLEAMGHSLTKVAIVSIGSSAFFIVTAFVFYAVSLMFIVRYVNIIFLLILSPIMVMGSVLPKISEQSRDWWKRLTAEALFAPLFMIMIWVVLTVINSSGFVCTNGNMTGIFTGLVNSTTLGSGCAGGNMALIMNYIIIISFIIGALTISKTTASQGGSVGEKIVGKALGMGAGSAGYVGRRTVGSAGRTLSDSEYLKQKASEKGLGGIAARMTLRTSQKAATGTFDARASSFAKMGDSLGVKGLDMGKAGGKGGYDAYTKAKAEAHTKFADSLKPSDLAIDEATQAFNNASNATEKAEAQARLDTLKGVSKKVMDKKINEERKVRLDNAVVEKKEVGTERDAEIKKATDESGLAEAKQKEKELQDDIAKRQEEIKTTIIPELKSQREEELKKVEETLTEQTTNREGIENNLNERVVKITKDYAEKIKSADERIGKINAEYDKRVSENTEGILSTGEQRKRAYANVITRVGEVSLHRVGLVGKVKRSNKVAAAKIRKGDKSEEQQLAELAKKMIAKEAKEKGEKIEEESEGAEKPEPTTPPQPTPPATS